MKITLKIALFATALGLIGCTTTSSLQKELAVGGIPKFDGYVTPIKIPVLLRYKPTDFGFKASVAMSIDIERKTEKFHIEMTGESKIRKLGDLLTQDFALEKLVSNGRTAFLPAGLAVLRLMDARGNIQEMEFVGVASSEKEQKAVEEIIETLKNIPTLPEMPVQSGDYWRVEYGPFARSMMAEDTEFAELFGGFFEFEYTVDGWGVVNDRKLMVVSIDKTIKKRIEGEDIQITRNGYQLWDVETAQRVEHRELIGFLLRDNPSFSMKMLLHVTQF